MKMLTAIRGKVGEIALDAAGLAGAGMVSYGAGEVYQPAAWIIGGILLIAGVLLIARRG